MDESLAKNTTIHISSKSHLNLTFNLYKCGSHDLPPCVRLSIPADDTFTLMYANQGYGQIDFDGLNYRLEGPSGFFIFPDTSYFLTNVGDSSLNVIWLSFSGYGIESYLNRANIYRAQPVFLDKESRIGERFNRIYEAAHQFPNRYCRMMSSLYDIFSNLIDMYQPKHNESYVDRSDYYAVRAVAFIERNYDQNISVDDIAASLGISRKHLYSIFNDILKISPKQYLIYYRIEKACIRLKLSANTVLEVAESVGYTNQFYFAKEFKRLTGMTPSEYRKNPNSGKEAEIFSYRTFVPALHAKFKTQHTSNASDKTIQSVLLPPYTAQEESNEKRT